VLGYRNTPAGPRMLRPWMTCPVRLWAQPVGSYGCSGAIRTVGPAGPAGSVAATGLRRCGPVVRPIQASLPLVSSVRNCSDTISPPKRYWR
jgi:hypothetical protein